MFLVHFHRDSHSKCAACEREKHQTASHAAYRASLPSVWSSHRELLVCANVLYNAVLLVENPIWWSDGSSALHRVAYRNVKCEMIFEKQSLKCPQTAGRTRWKEKCSSALRKVIAALCNLLFNDQTSVCDFRCTILKRVSPHQHEK